MIEINIVVTVFTRLNAAAFIKFQRFRCGVCLRAAFIRRRCLFQNHIS